MIDDIKKRLDAGTDIGEHIHRGVSSGSCTEGAYTEENPTFDDLIKACEDVSKKGLVKLYNHKLNLDSKVITIELFDKDGRLLFCCSDMVSSDFIKDCMELVSKQYIDNKPTFDDLIDVAVRAVKDDVIVIRRFHSSLLNFEKIGETKHASDVEVTRYSDIESIESAIDFINSLYTETFVIESVDDTDKINDPASIKLLNGEECEYIGGKIKHGCATYEASYILLKGATVTQKVK